MGRLLIKIGQFAIFPTLGTHVVKFWTAKWTHVPVGCAKFHVNRCNKSPPWGKNADFRPVSKLKYGILPVNKEMELAWTYTVKK